MTNTVTASQELLRITKHYTGKHYLFSARDIHLVLTHSYRNIDSPDYATIRRQVEDLFIEGGLGPSYRREMLIPPASWNQIPAAEKLGFYVYLHEDENVLTYEGGKTDSSLGLPDEPGTPESPFPGSAGAIYKKADSEGRLLIPKDAILSINGAPGRDACVWGWKDQIHIGIGAHLYGTHYTIDESTNIRFSVNRIWEEARESGFTTRSLTRNTTFLIEKPQGSYFLQITPID